MKKYLAAFLACALVVTCFTGCLNSGKPAATEAPKATEAPAATEAPKASEEPKAAEETKTEEKATELKSDATTLRFSSAIKNLELTTAPNGIGVQAMQDYLIGASNGSFGMDMYLEGTLGSSTDELIGGCQTGAFEMTSQSFAGWGDYTNGFMCLDIPFLFSSSEQMWKFIDGEYGKTIKDKVEADTGLKVLAFLDLGFRNLTANKEIKTPADMKGLKLRTQNDRYQMAAMEALGASCTTISFSELYSALQQGLVDAQENPISNTYTNKMYEVQSNMTLTRHVYNFTIIAVSVDAFNKLTAEQQQWLLDAGRAGELASRQALTELEGKYLEELAKYMTIFDPSLEELAAFQEQAKSSWSIIEADMGTEAFQAVVAAAEAAK